MSRETETVEDVRNDVREQYGKYLALPLDITGVLIVIDRVADAVRRECAVGTCKIEEYSHGETYFGKCDVCGETVEMYVGYCSNCGRKVEQ